MNYSFLMRSFKISYYLVYDHLDLVIIGTRLGLKSKRRLCINIPIILKKLHLIYDLESYKSLKTK